jgi:anaerobic ribonucleoside-triphosphate reductase
MSCNEKCDVYSRVVGYFTPTRQWNKGKQEEFKNRVTFKEQNAENKKEICKESC